MAEAPLEAAQATANRVRIDEARAAAVEEQARQDHQRESDLLTGGVSSQAERDKALERLRIAESDLKTAHAATAEAVLRVVTAEPSRSHPGVVARLGRQTGRETREFLVDVRVEQLPLNWAVGQRGALVDGRRITRT